MRVKFPNLESSKYHEDSVLKTVTLPATTLAEDRHEHHQFFLKILFNVRFLARQALPLRGNGDECDSNYNSYSSSVERMMLGYSDWLKKKTNKYTI